MARERLKQVNLVRMPRHRGADLTIAIVLHARAHAHTHARTHIHLPISQIPELQQVIYKYWKMCDKFKSRDRARQALHRVFAPTPVLTSRSSTHPLPFTLSPPPLNALPPTQFPLPHSLPLNPSHSLTYSAPPHHLSPVPTTPSPTLRVCLVGERAYVNMHIRMQKALLSDFDAEEAI